MQSSTSLDAKPKSLMPAEDLRWVKSIAIFTIALGLSVLVGWVWNTDVLKSPFTGMVVMKVNAATAFILSGICLYLHTLRQPSHEHQQLLITVMNTSKFNNPLENNWENCRTRLLDNSAVVECITEVIRCEMAVPFGNRRICNHPSVIQFALKPAPDKIIECKRHCYDTRVQV